MDRYDPHAIESRWQAVWAEEGTGRSPTPASRASIRRSRRATCWRCSRTRRRAACRALKNYAIGDAIAHFRRRNGFQVLHPMGYDAFGLPAENAAIRTGEHPRLATSGRSRKFREQFHSWGISIDWRREIATCEPSTTAGPSGSSCASTSVASPTAPRLRSSGARKDQTVLANEQVIDGHCERCGTLVVRAQPRAVVLQDHRLPTGCWTTSPPRVLAPRTS